MAVSIPKELQDKLASFEQIKAQLQMVMAQRADMDARKREMESAVKALEERKEGDVYRRVGDLMMKVEDIEGLKKSMSEELEVLSVRSRSMETQEKSMREYYENLGKELNESLKRYR